MTTDPQTDRPTGADRPAPSPLRPYDVPALTPLGAVGAVTAGPDGEKTLDGLVGSDGGFRQADQTS